MVCAYNVAMKTEHKHELTPPRRTITVQERDYSVMLYNCYCHRIELVVLQLEKVLGCSLVAASRYAMVAEQFGTVCVFKGTIETCSQVAYELSAMLLEVDIE